MSSEFLIQIVRPPWIYLIVYFVVGGPLPFIAKALRKRLEQENNPSKKLICVTGLTESLASSFPGAWLGSCLQVYLLGEGLLWFFLTLLLCLFLFYVLDVFCLNTKKNNQKTH